MSRRGADGSSNDISGGRKKAVGLDMGPNSKRGGAKSERMKAQSRDLYFIRWNARVGCKLSNVGST